MAEVVYSLTNGVVGRTLTIAFISSVYSNKEFRGNISLSLTIHVQVSVAESVKRCIPQSGKRLSFQLIICLIDVFVDLYLSPLPLSLYVNRHHFIFLILKNCKCVPLARAHTVQE